MDLCKCGCNREIIIKVHHKYVGIPDYIHGHNRNGKHNSIEHIEKLRKANIGKHHSKETIDKMIKAHIGIYPSEEHKRQQSKSRKSFLQNGGKIWNDGLTKEENNSLKSISEKKKQYLLEYGLPHQKSYFVSELGHKVANSWEEITGIWLRRNNKSYCYEKPFLYITPDGIRHNYYADFALADEKVVYEPKGYFRSEKDKLKLQLFKDQYPDYKLILIGRKDRLEKELISGIHYNEIININELKEKTREIKV